MNLSEFLSRFPERLDEPDGYVVRCPAHADSRPSLRVAVSEKGALMLRCRAGCETDEVRKALDLEWSDLFDVDTGGAPTPVATSRETLPGPAEIARLAVWLDEAAKALWEPEGAPALEYAERRFGVDRELARRLGLGYTTELGGGPRLVVPFRNPAGVALGYQARALSNRPKVRWMGPANPEGAAWSRLAYLTSGTGWEEILITEGPGDGLTACSAGYDTILIRGAGLASSDTMADQIAEIVGDRVAVIAGDGDSAGQKFTKNLAGLLATRGVRVKSIDVPEGEDLSSWREADPEAFSTEFVRAVRRAEDVQVFEAVAAQWDEEKYPLTDLGAARRLRDYIEECGSGVRYAPEIGFYLLDGGVWQVDGLNRVRTYAQEVADLVSRIATILQSTSGDAADDTMRDAQKKKAARLSRFAHHVQSSRGIDAMLRELEALKGVPARAEDFDQHPDLLAARNGVIDLRTGQLRPHDPSLLLTRRIEHDYDPEARAPRWERFLEEVFPGRPELPAFIQRLVGYGITGSTAEQCFAVLYGTGANGKSVFTDTLSEVFRSITTTTPFETFEQRPSGGIPNDLAALRGSRLVFAAEGESGRVMAEALIKRVTGRDLISARFMRREFFEFRPTFLLWLATNSKPNFRGQDEGLWRRVKLIPWDRFFKPEERDHRLGETLLAEAPGILSWAVRGAVEWFARGGLDEPAVVRDGTRQYRETSDVLGGLISASTSSVWLITGDRDDVVPAQQLWDSYLQWTEDENLPPRERWKRTTFFHALEERGLVKTRRSSGTVFLGARRVRQSDIAEETEGPASERAEDAPLAHAQTENDTAPPAPDLDDVL